MNVPQELDPRVKGLERWAKGAGVAGVAVAASAVIIVVGTSVIAAAVVGLAALVAVNFGVPVGARYIALKKQQTLTKLAEAFSEETIREDERNEGERIHEMEKAYMTSRAELEGAIEELCAQLQHASDEERAMLQSQIDALKEVIVTTESTLEQRKQDFVELQRVNKLYISFHRSSAAMQRAQGAERNPQELQRLETARTAIKMRMRQALAGQTVEAMSARVQPKLNVSRVARIGNSQATNVLVSPTAPKE